jgi:hypothetical protein
VGRESRILKLFTKEELPVCNQPNRAYQRDVIELSQMPNQCYGTASDA